MSLPAGAVSVRLARREDELRRSLLGSNPYKIVVSLAAEGSADQPNVSADVRYRDSIAPERFHDRIVDSA
jgi:hypothetical protein